MSKENKLILQGIRWLIQRDSMKPEFREIFDNSITKKIDDLLYSKEYANSQQNIEGKK